MQNIVPVFNIFLGFHIILLQYSFTYIVIIKKMAYEIDYKKA